MKRSYRNFQVIALAFALILYTGIRTFAEGAYFVVTRVVDGDTLKLSDGSRVRLIGVDTPEVHYSEKLLRDAKKQHRDIEGIKKLGQKASDFTRRLCLNKRVRLEFDVQRRDRYGRLLAYVYLKDGTFVNAKIVEEGYGQIMTVPPNVKYADIFLKLQRKARENNRGLWRDDARDKNI